MLSPKKNLLSLFFIGWFVINLIQSGFTELFDDEAYYWVYSRFLSWGYFDHPPMIALLIRAGYFLFPNELGVRLLVSALSAGTVIILYDLLRTKDKLLFIYILCSVALLQIGGFIAVPDVPLLFFTVAFFCVYRRFLQKNSVANALLLGLSMALVLYSKYHGLLIILFTLISNFKLLKNPKAYLAAGFAFVLMFPHLYWQFQHGFPSLQYHLYERTPLGFKISTSLEYILGQILAAGPLMGWLLLWLSFRHQTVDFFERALKYSMVGIYLFFFIASFKGRIEVNWTSPALMPMVILSHHALMSSVKWKNILKASVPFTLLTVFALRIYMIVDVSPSKWIQKDEVHGNKKWTASINKRAGDQPVVFINTYQKASKYWFYTGNLSLSLNTPNYRRNNFNFWPIEDSLRGKKVYAVILEDSAYFPDIIREIPQSKISRGKMIDSFYSNSTVRLICKKDLFVSGKKLKSFSAKIFLPDNHSPATKETLPFSIYLFAYSGDRMINNYKLWATPDTSGSWNLSTDEEINLPAGKYPAHLAISSVFPNIPSLNSTIYKLTVE